MTPNPCKIGSPEWLAEIRAQYRTDEEIDSWYQPEEPDGYARRVVSDLVRMIDALADERDAALSLEDLPLSEWPADTRDKRHSLELSEARKEARDRMRAAEDDRDRLAAALADLREAGRAIVEMSVTPYNDRGNAATRRWEAVLRATPTDIAATHDARVRASALREAAERLDRGREWEGWGWGVKWLRSEAERIERGGR